MSERSRPSLIINGHVDRLYKAIKDGDFTYIHAHKAVLDLKLADCRAQSFQSSEIDVIRQNNAELLDLFQSSMDKLSEHFDSFARNLANSQDKLDANQTDNSWDDQIKNAAFDAERQVKAHFESVVMTSVFKVDQQDPKFQDASTDRVVRATSAVVEAWNVCVDCSAKIVDAVSDRANADWSYIPVSQQVMTGAVQVAVDFLKALLGQAPVKRGRYSTFDAALNWEPTVSPSAAVAELSFVAARVLSNANVIIDQQTLQRDKSTGEIVSITSFGRNDARGRDFSLPPSLEKEWQVAVDPLPGMRHYIPGQTRRDQSQNNGFDPANTLTAAAESKGFYQTTKKFGTGWQKPIPSRSIIGY